MSITLVSPITSPASAANLVLHLVILGVAAAFIFADRNSPTTRALAASFALWGAQQVAPTWLRVLELQPGNAWLVELSYLPGTLSSVAFAEWLLRVIHAAPAQGAIRLIAVGLLRSGQVVVILSVLCAASLPDLYRSDYLERVDGWSTWGFVLFKGLELLTSAAFFAPFLILMMRGIDFGERPRVVAALASVPFFLLSGFLPNGLPIVIATLLGVLVFLVGSTRYYSALGLRAGFLAQFLSPSLSRDVSEHGFANTLRRQKAEISVVVADLRGFTAYCNSLGSDLVMDTLSQFYDIVGQVCYRHQGTVKDFAGDGVLILVGAPQKQENHAEKALKIAHDLQQEVAHMCKELPAQSPALGLGVGVATGEVTAGIIESSSHFEYAAVGAAVNLASRLCAQADTGEILISETTRYAVHNPPVTQRPDVLCKGFDAPVKNFLLKTG